MSDQPKPTSGNPCHVTGPSSRICEHGTKSCEVRHIKPTGEWTGLSLARLIKEKGYKGAADSHNAAIAAERRDKEVIDHKRKSQSEAYDRIRAQHRRQISDWVAAAEGLQQQLAAEREKARRTQELLDEAVRLNGENVNKVQTLVDALKSINSQLCANFPLGTNREIIQEIDHALAKVKVGK